MSSNAFSEQFLCRITLTATLCNDAFCNKQRIVIKLSHMVIKLPHFIKKTGAFCYKILSHAVIKYLTNFVKKYVAFCDKVSQ